MTEATEAVVVCAEPEEVDATASIEAMVFHKCYCRFGVENNTHLFLRATRNN